MKSRATYFWENGYTQLIIFFSMGIVSSLFGVFGLSTPIGWTVAVDAFLAIVIAITIRNGRKAYRKYTTDYTETR